MMNFYILHVLENIFTIALQSVHIDVAAEHEGVGAVVKLQIVDVQSVTTPKHFIGIIHLHVFYFYIVHLAEHFGGINDCVLHHQVV